MNYLLIEEKAWDELLAQVRRTTEKVRLLEHHLTPAPESG